MTVSDIDRDWIDFDLKFDEIDTSFLCKSPETREGSCLEKVSYARTWTNSTDVYDANHLLRELILGPYEMGWKNRDLFPYRCLSNTLVFPFSIYFEEEKQFYSTGW